MASLRFNDTPANMTPKLDTLIAKNYNDELVKDDRPAYTQLNTSLNDGFKNFLLYISESVQNAAKLQNDEDPPAYPQGLPAPVYVGVEYVVKYLENQMKKLAETIQAKEKEGVPGEKINNIMNHIKGWQQNK